jgi:hypothetical protein
MPNGAMEFERLRSAYQQRLCDFIDVELKLGLTFAEFAQMERDLGNVEHFRRATFDAKTAAASVRRFLARITDLEFKAVASERLAKLTQVVAAL